MVLGALDVICYNMDLRVMEGILLGKRHLLTMVTCLYHFSNAVEAKDAVATGVCRTDNPVFHVR